MWDVPMRDVIALDLAGRGTGSRHPLRRRIAMDVPVRIAVG
ncbi:MAG: hypothetical protein ACFB6R_13180 [Alphaproteobacteria bacterium]